MDFMFNDESTISDVFWIHSFVGRLRDCLESGKLIPFSEAAFEDREDDAPCLFYVDDPTDGNLMDIVLDCVVDELHHDVISTYSDMLHNVDVRVYLGEFDDEPNVDLLIYPKGGIEEHRRAFLCIDPTDPVYGISA